MGRDPWDLYQGTCIIEFAFDEKQTTTGIGEEIPGSIWPSEQRTI